MRRHLTSALGTAFTLFMAVLLAGCNTPPPTNPDLPPARYNPQPGATYAL